MTLSNGKYYLVLTAFFVAAVASPLLMHLANHSMSDCSAARTQTTDCWQAAQNYSSAFLTDMFYFSFSLTILFISNVFWESISMFLDSVLRRNANFRSVGPPMKSGFFLIWLISQRGSSSDHSSAPSCLGSVG